MRAAWTWITSLPKWWLVPSIAIALGALWALFRLSAPRNRVIGGTSPKAGKKALKEIRTASEDEARRIDEHSAAEKAEIEKKWHDSLVMLVLTAVAFSGCASGIPAPKTPAWPGALTAPHMALSEGCSYADEAHLLVQCPGPLFARSLVEIADMKNSLAHTARRLNESLQTANIREDIANTRVASAEEAVDDARTQRWAFLGGGVALGVVMTAIVGVVVSAP